jgi:hypothetical protein
MLQSVENWVSGIEVAVSTSTRSRVRDEVGEYRRIVDRIRTIRTYGICHSRHLPLDPTPPDIAYVSKFEESMCFAWR